MFFLLVCEDKFVKCTSSQENTSSECLHREEFDTKLVCCLSPRLCGVGWRVTQLTKSK